MKKILSFALAVVMFLGLCACTSSGNTDNGGETTAAATEDSTAGQLLVGYGKVDVTPEYSVPLRGYGATERRMSTGFLSRIYLIAVAVTDTEGNTAILIAADNCGTPEGVYTKAAAQIEKEYGIPAENVIVSAIHQHSCPDLKNDKVPSAVKYRDDVYTPALVEAAKAALDNRSPVTDVMTTSFMTEKMNFVRHFIMEDGTYAGPNFGNLNQKAVDYASKPDEQMQLVKFVRKGQTTLDGKEAKDIVLTNYQGHPLMGTSGKDTNIHSDLIGVYRDELEKELDCQAIYFTGASGNMMFTTNIEADKHGNNYKEHGKALAKLAIGADDTYSSVELTQVKASKVTFTGECNHTEDHLVDKAKEAYDHWYNTGDKSLIEKYGFESQYHCSAITSHVNLPATMDLDIYAISIGDIAFVGAPYEMFSTTAMAIKENSPFKTTIITTSANGGSGYFPTMDAWDYGCYEQYSSVYVRGTAEKLGDEFISMLKQLHGE